MLNSLNIQCIHNIINKVLKFLFPRDVLFVRSIVTYWKALTIVVNLAINPYKGKATVISITVVLFINTSEI